jgi:hypothetical protein
MTFALGSAFGRQILLPQWSEYYSSSTADLYPHLLFPEDPNSGTCLNIRLVAELTNSSRPLGPACCARLHFQPLYGYLHRERRLEILT